MLTCSLSVSLLQDTAELALRIQQESPVKRGVLSESDRRLQRSVLSQIDANMDDIHCIFFRLPMRERMEIIAQDRAALRERMFRWNVSNCALAHCHCRRAVLL